MNTRTSSPTTEQTPTPDATVRLHAQRHGFVKVSDFRCREDCVQHLIHLTAYERALRLCANKRVLDLGCNLGYGSKVLARSAASVTGVDVSPRSIEEARKSNADPRVRFEVIDGVALPFTDGAFDVVVSFQVIEHIARTGPFLSELRRVLVGGGVALLTTPNAEIRLDPGMRPWNEFHVREYSAAEFRDELVPRFAQVQVYGLFATDDVYRVEFARVDGARAQARRSSHGLGKVIAAVKSHAKRVLPVSLVASLTNARSRLRGGAEESVDGEFMAQHGVNDFFYRTTALDRSLDLLALCSDADLRSAVATVVPEAEAGAS